MKKTLCLILALTMIFSLAGCGKSEKTPDVKQSNIIEPYLDEEGNFVSSLSKFVVEPDKYFPKSTVETNSEDDGSRIMVYVEFCTQEEIDAYAADAKGDRFVKLSYSGDDGKGWNDAEGWYSFAVATEDSGDDEQPLNALFIYCINSDFAYDLRHPKVEESPVPTVEPTPEPTPEPVEEKDIRWDVIREHVKMLSITGPVYTDEESVRIIDYMSENSFGSDDGTEIRELLDEDPALYVAVFTFTLSSLLKEENVVSDKDFASAAKALQFLFTFYYYDYDNENLNTSLTNDELELLETIYQNSEILDVLPEILSDK